MEQIPSNAPIMEPKPGVSGWFSIWMKAVTNPNEQTYLEITESPEATTQTALTWAVIAGFVNGLVLALVLILTTFLQVDPNLSSNIGGLIGFICIPPIAGAIVMPIGLVISAGITQWIARLFGGNGSFEKLLYAFSAIIFPLILVSTVITLFSAIPLVGLCISFLAYIVAFYQIYLQVVAVKAVNQLSWGKAVASVLILPCILLVIACLLFVILY